MLCEGRLSGVQEGVSWLPGRRATVRNDAPEVIQGGTRREVGAANEDA